MTNIKQESKVIMLLFPDFSCCFIYFIFDFERLAIECGFEEFHHTTDYINFCQIEILAIEAAEI